jgi:hypothetical protein
MVIYKARNDGSASWRVAHKSLSTNNQLALNATDAQFSQSPVNLTASTFETGVSVTNGQSSGSAGTPDIIAYCFHSVDGYSKVGSYKGNGSADGTFVFTGFRPSYILLKESDFLGESWQVYDNKRSANNVAWDVLAPNTSSAEASGSGLDLDMLSNGFKIRFNNNQFNDPASTYIYLAFAEQPFKHSNAR